MLKVLFIFLGTVSLVLGIIGIVTPGLPTTPFLLLTAGLYLRSSKKLYSKLVANRYFGPYIVNYQKNKGISKTQKIKALALQWTMITISCIWGLDNNLLRVIVVFAGLIGSYILVAVVPTSQDVMKR